jgi:hypothetical protein
MPAILELSDKLNKYSNRSGTDRRIYNSLRETIDSISTLLKNDGTTEVRFNHYIKGNKVIGVGLWRKREAEPTQDTLDWLKQLPKTQFEREVYLLEKEGWLVFKDFYFDMRSFIRLKKERPILADIFCAYYPEVFNNNKEPIDRISVTRELSDRHNLKEVTISILLEIAEECLFTSF